VRKRLLIPIGSLLAAIAVAGGVFAYFTSTGSGFGSASAGSVSNVTLSPGSASSPLYPGGTGDVDLTVANPNGVQVKIPSLVLDTSQGTAGFSVDGGHSGCVLSTLSFTTDSTGWTVPANAAAYHINLANAIAMSTSAVNACQGATFTVYLKVGS
jgi:hypothetical protein